MEPSAWRTLRLMDDDETQAEPAAPSDVDDDDVIDDDHSTVPEDLLVTDEAEGQDAVVDRDEHDEADPEDLIGDPID